ncbi:uncharacterized protein BCR38DRAFT_84583 [Pseudomassariella vexata]|uniref:Uncharacterized protein n=1 Tax=Pseudomassariella vexata TaxID=1141098 RepID=A0A1Y2DEA6_9PEZI|nr:uncharacterized protein BCR38DRAFT_84583 [Pseudomassariella vexata]ORY57537.1 hypothetical protein BCR38DRAFT_84583 [Pseudomassariella vexata]
MLQRGKVPDAWDDDDWEAQADKTALQEPKPEPAQARLSKKERLAQHAESNRKLWESAETNQIPFHLATAPSPPLAQPFKAPMTVLARKPKAAAQIVTRDPVTGLSTLSIQDDSDDETDRKPQETPEEIRARQQREREEKQRRYDEVRAKIFGDGGGGGGSGGGRGRSNPSSGTSTPGTTTPPRDGNGARRGRGRGRGGFRGADRGGGGGNGGGVSITDQRPSSRPTSQSGGASLREQGREKELYDPGYALKPGFTFEKKTLNGGAPLYGRSTPRDEERIIRTPRGPDADGRGFGFARRGAKEG